MFEKSTSDARPYDGDQPQHRCIAGASCRATVIEDGERRPAYTEQPGTLCDGCTAHHSAATSRLLRDYAMLRVTLGERRTHQNSGIHSTPSPRIPIDATSDRLMTEIVEWTGYAADLISAELHVPTRDGGRNLPTQIHFDDEHLIERYGNHTVDLEKDALAARSWETTHPTENERLTAYMTVIDRNLDTLAAIPAHDVQIWAQPRRCDAHAEQISTAKRMLTIAREIRDHGEITEAISTLQAAFAAAGACNECCGWSEDGRYQARQEVRMSGLDVLFRLTRTHQLIRQHLGHTRIRHQYAMPCPNCGSPVGRDDGTTTITCDNDHCTKAAGKWGPSSWTEREYQLLSGMMADDERTRALSRYLLTEAYTRLDGIAKLIADLESDERLKDAEAVQLILAAVKPHLDGHLKPADRKIATDKAAAEKRQATEDNWAWKRTPAYVKPKKKRKPEPNPDRPKVTQSSRSTLTDTDDTIVDQLRLGPPKCPHCNLIHRGECA